MSIVSAEFGDVTRFREHVVFLEELEHRGEVVSDVGHRGADVVEGDGPVSAEYPGRALDV
jgi:hypothetical protein